MTVQALSRPLLPTPEEASLAKESGRTVAAVLETRVETQEFNFPTSSGVKQVTVPVSALRLFVEILTQMGSGNAVTVIPIHAELTTQEAADHLNVSRPFLIGLLEKNEIPHHKVGKHRRIRYQDVIAYKERIDADRKKVLDELAAQAQELNLGYE